MNYMLPFPLSTTPRGGEYGSTVLDTGKKRANWHRGHDFAPGAGKPIPSVADGVVSNRGHSSSVGNWVEVRNDDGCFFTYSHMGKPTVFRVGERLTAGQIIGYVGSSGNVTGPHLHLSCSFTKGGGLSWVGIINPVLHIQNQSAQNAPASTHSSGGSTGGGYSLMIVDARGLQEMLKRLYGYAGNIDNQFGKGSWEAFARFLAKNWGYSGNAVPGPKMWAAIARWLRAKYGYTGNDVPGPVMRAALQRASTANAKAY